MRRLAPLLLFTIALPLAAQTDVGVYVSGARAGSTDADGSTLAFDRGRGAGASISFGNFELAATSLRYDGALRLDGASASLGRLRLVPITLTRQWRFRHAYVGAGAAYVKASELSSADLDATGIGPIDVESKACWLANAGVNVGRFFVDGKYLNYRPQSTAAGNRVRLDLKPVVLSFGLRFKL
jgi:hypothetical protein